MLLLGIPIQQIESLLLIFTRVTGIFISAPVLNSSRIPTHTKIGFSFLVAMLLLPLAGVSTDPLPGDPLPYLVLVAKEAVIGVAIGFVAQLVFSAVQMAGELADLQTGFAFAGMVDPFTAERSSIIGQFQVLMAWLIFLAVDGHHMLLSGVAESFRLAPLGSVSISTAAVGGIMHICARTLTIALQIGAPIVGAVLLVDLAIGLLARTVPQMNILVLGFPVKMLLGLVVLVIALPLSVTLERNLVFVIKDAIGNLFSFMGH